MSTWTELTINGPVDLDLDVMEAQIREHIDISRLSDGEELHHAWDETSVAVSGWSKYSLALGAEPAELSRALGPMFTVEFYEGKPMSVELPATVDLTVVETEPGLKGATVSNVTKPATLETGAVVQVPLFVNVGDRIKVDPREKRYIQRA